MPATEYTPRQRAALSWSALVQASAPWRDIIPHRLSFTEPGWDPLTQIYGSIARGLAQLHIGPGCAAGLGFAALDEQDARDLLEEWLHLLAPAPAGTVSRPSLRKEPPQ